ncbi:hypothetical protein D5086_017414 [Populus alba]|uniref:Uncharacterized protein n=1 Tax=Populus alba TaxID=43335 RepID=A0ACC4BX74_POPAL
MGLENTNTIAIIEQTKHQAAYLRLIVIGTRAIPLSVGLPYRLYEGDHWNSKRPSFFRDQVVNLPYVSRLVNEMAIITKSSIVEYGKNSELSQLTEGDCLRSDAKKMSPIKNLNCIMNEVNKLTTHFQNVDKDAFFRKYERLVEIARVEVLSPTVRALVHFWDPDYRCFSFGSIDLCPTVEEYGLLTEFPNNLY